MRPIFSFSACGFCLILLVYLSCGPPNSDPKENESTDDSVILTPYSGSSAIGITYEVRDFNSWMKVYKAHSDKMARVGIYTNVEDPDQITVFELTRGYEEAVAWYRSQEFRDILELEGVTSEAVFAYFDVKFMTTRNSDKKYRVGISHEVEDYDYWKKLFDADEPFRQLANLELWAISTTSDNPSLVNVVFATDNIKQARELINSSQMRDRMTAAGVLGEPSIATYQVVEEKVK